MTSTGTAPSLTNSLTNRTTTSTRSTLAALARRQGGVILRRQAQDAGLAREQVRALVQHGSWLALHRGVYLTGGLAPDGSPPLRARLWAAHLRCGPSSVIALGSAARALHLTGLPRELPYVDVLLPRGRHPRPDLGLRVQIGALAPGEVVRLRGLPVTAPARTLADLLLRLPEEQALSLLDSALHRGVLPDLGPVDRAVRYRPGADRARRLLPLADGRAASALESVARLDCIRGGVPPDELKHRVLDDRGRQLARADFCWHWGLRQALFAHADDRVPRQARPPLPRGAPEPLHFTWADARQPGRVAELVRAALDPLRLSPPRRGRPS